jgi:Flp pilus assembly protein TadD
MADLLAKATDFFHHEQYEEAITTYMQVLQEDPQNLMALTSISAAYMKLQRFGEAISYLDTALELQPDNAALYSERGVSYFLNTQIEEALLDLNKAQELEPENPYRYSSRAFVRDKAGDPHGAVADYRKAVELDPEDAISYNNLGLIQEKLGNRDLASKNFTIADAIDGYLTVPPEADKQQPEQNVKIPPARRKRLSMKQYSHVARTVFTTRRGFKDFINFLLRRKRA